ncbi:MAG: ATP-binding protein [Candidatus Methanomethylophilaceae archaeon]
MNTIAGLVDRPRYTERIRPFIGNGNAKIITGIRRCGKSSVMRLFSRSFTDHNVVYLNMELAENYNLRDWRSLLGKVESAVDATRKNVLFIDEVQNVKEWELAIRDIIARELYDVYLTGSNSDLLSSEYATHLGGRFNTIHMLPLSYTECLEFQKMFGGADDVFHTFVRAGGFPILWRNPADIQSDMQTVRDIVDVSIANDIEERFGIKNKQLLKNLLRYTLSTIGNYVSANNLYNTMRSTGIRVSADTVYEYLRYLESANIIIRAKTFDIKGKRVLTAKYKYYVTDLGIKHALLGYRPEDTPGHIENMIFTELLGRGYGVYIGSSDGKEIDFVAEKGDKRIYIQACQTIQSEETMEREFGNLESIRDNFPKYVVMMDPGVYEGTTDTGIICCSLTEFLSSVL